MSVRQVSELETNAVSIERVKEYTQVDTENAWQVEATAPPPEWPTEGAIQVVGYRTRYRESLALALKDLSFCVRPHEKVGVCGRTGIRALLFARHSYFRGAL